MRAMLDRLRRRFWAVFILLLCSGIVAADDPVAKESSSLLLSHRELREFELADIVLVSTLGGSLEARNRNTGHVMWTLESSPLVDVRETNTKASQGSSAVDSNVLWLVEPSEKGGLYFFTPEGGIERIPASVCDLVQKAPFGMVENLVYTGSRQTILYALDVRTGEIVQTFGDSADVAYAQKSQIDPAGVIMIGRTEYTLNIHEHTGSPGWRIHIGTWTPNSRDQDLALQYTTSMDSLYLTPLSNTSIVALAENDMRPQRWVGETSSLLIDVFDILVDKSDGYLSLVRQPPLNLSGMATQWDLYVSNSPSNVPVVVSGPRYAALLGSALSDSSQLASYCTGAGSGILGVHPRWCQDKRRVPNSVSPAISLLPPASTNTQQPYLLLDPPANSSQRTEDRGNWSVALRVVENITIVVLVFALFTLSASQGWLPVDLLAALQHWIGKANKLQSQNQRQQQLQKSAGEEPKKRKRGARGGRRGNNNNNSNGTVVVNGTRLKGREDEKGKLPRNVISGDSPITITDTVIGYGSHGTAVFKGQFEGRDVAVKRMLLDFYDIASQEVDILRESDDHPNVVRYYCKYETDQFLYIALELCPGTLEDMIRKNEKLSIMYEPFDALRQVTLGLQHLHNLQIVHRDIKPQNILVSLPPGRIKNRKALLQTLGVRYLISDFGLCRKLEGEQSSFLPTSADSVAGTAGWAAPEIINQDPQDKTRLTKAVDIFSMGCLFYYVLSGGMHPFGSDTHSRQTNIGNRRQPVLKPGNLITPEAMDLIPQMLNMDPNLRPSTERILKHPLFWTDQLKLDFLVKVSDRLEHESREEHSDLIDRLESRAADVVGNDWHTKFPQIFIDNLGKYRRYHGDRILDLLRAMRNKLHHYNDFSDELKECVGSLPSGYLMFFTSRFPQLLIAVYHYADAEFRTEEAFQPFF